MADKRQLICPITSICRLILLNFCEKGTKITIYNNAIQLIDPIKTQGIVRWWNGDSRTDIFVLYNMIINFIELYLCAPDKHTDEYAEEEEDAENKIILNETTHNNLKKLSVYLCKGIMLLQPTYEHDNVTLTLQYYILLIKAGINETYTKDLLPQHLCNNNKINFLNIIKIKEILNDDKIDKLHDLFVKAFEAKESNSDILVEAYIQAIIIILDNQDKLFREIIDASMK